MIQVFSGQTNDLLYISRYNRIDYFEIYNENTNITTSGLTTLIGDGSKILHSGLTYQFEDNIQYMYRAFYIENNKKYLSSTQLLRCWDNRLKNIKPIVKPKNTYKIKK